MKRPESPRTRINFFRVVSKEFGRTIFGEKPTVMTADESLQSVVDEILGRNEIQARMFQACLTAPALGDIDGIMDLANVRRTKSDSRRAS